MLSATVDDPVFGTVELTVDHDTAAATVRGQSLPPVSIRRRPGTTSDHRTPIGSRAPADLELLVDGEPVPVRPGLGFVSRRSRRVDVRYGGHDYRLCPTTSTRSVLLRDGVPIGDLQALAGAGTRAHWSAGSGVTGVEAALAYALAAAFGIGSPGLVKSAIGAGAVSPPF
ncbi:hypothetical protein GCM10009760_29040 [Kitasatospora kazusensis]|uniref:Uncharacterized protein n=1 Tax=Kitasatospora kazusensis TaxID=407974 RepID=A0ABP5L833_9ACTN